LRLKSRLREILDDIKIEDAELKENARKLLVPLAIRCDNVPENISGVIQSWARQAGITLEYIHLGKPEQNAYIEIIN
jgi:transposase InsO family protein